MRGGRNVYARWDSGWCAHRGGIEQVDVVRRWECLSFREERAINARGCKTQRWCAAAGSLVDAGEVRCERHAWGGDDGKGENAWTRCIGDVGRLTSCAAEGWTWDEIFLLARALEVSECALVEK